MKFIVRFCCFCLFVYFPQRVQRYDLLSFSDIVLVWLCTYIIACHLPDSLRHHAEEMVNVGFAYFTVFCVGATFMAKYSDNR